MEYTNPDLPEEAKMALTEIEKQFISMRSSGLPIRKIAKTLNKSTRTICLWNKRFYRNIVEINSNEFNEFRNKIIKFKNAHLDFFIEEFQNVKLAMAKSGTLNKRKNWDYEGYLETMMKISKLVEKFESDLLISSDSVQKIDESKIIDAESEDIDTALNENNISSEQIKTENTDEILEENIENTFSKTLKSDENTGNMENHINENTENIVVHDQNKTKSNSSEHIDNT